MFFFRKLVGGYLLNVCVGSIFAYGRLAPGFARLTGSTAAQAAVIGLAGDVGIWLNIIPCTARDRFGDRFGFGVGALLVGVGISSTCVALSFGAHFAVVAVTWAVVGHGFCWLYCTNLISQVTSWEADARGYVVGSLQAFFGISGAVFVSIYDSLDDDDDDDGEGGKTLVQFLAFVGVLTLGVAALARRLAAGAPPMPMGGTLDALSRRRFHFVAAYVVGLLFFVVVTSLADQASWASSVIVASLLLLGPLLLGCFREDDEEDLSHQQQHHHQGQQQHQQQQHHHQERDHHPSEEGVVVARKRGFREPLAAVSSKHRVDFWELFVAFGCCVGGAIATSNSMGALARSLRRCDSDDLGTASLTLLTSSDAFARMVSGIVVNRGLCDGNVVVAISALLIAASHTAYSAAHPDASKALFLAASSMAGLANGAAWTACPWLCAARFGTNRYGDNFGLATFSAVLGVFLFVKAVLPLNDTPRDDRIDCPGRDDDGDDDDNARTCYGARCFAPFHRAIQAAGLAAFVLALDLERRRRRRLRLLAADRVLIDTTYLRMVDDDQVSTII